MNLIIYVTEAGRRLAQRILQELPSCHIMPVKAFSAENFNNSEGLIFIGAMGICVRTIAPFVKAKTMILLFSVWTAEATMSLVS